MSEQSISKPNAQTPNTQTSKNQTSKNQIPMTQSLQYIHELIRSAKKLWNNYMILSNIIVRLNKLEQQIRADLQKGISIDSDYLTALIESELIIREFYLHPIPLVFSDISDITVLFEYFKKTKEELSQNENIIMTESSEILEQIIKLRAKISLPKPIYITSLIDPFVSQPNDLILSIPKLPILDEASLLDKFSAELSGRFEELSKDYPIFGDQFWQNIKLNSIKCLIECYLQALQNIASNIAPLDFTQKNNYIRKQLDLVFNRYYDDMQIDLSSPLVLVSKIFPKYPQYHEIRIHVASAILSILEPSDFNRFL